ncbi:MAG: C25 family cysteine peptidase, partial [candidate division WOR-3 bacterium]
MKFLIIIIGMFLNQKGNTKVEYKLLEKSYEHFSIEISVSSLSYRIVNYENENFLEFDLKEIGITEEIGYPELPVLRKLFEITSGSDINFEIVEIEEEKISLKEMNLPRIKPRLPPLPKIKGAKQEFVINEEFYSKDEFYPESNFEVKKVGMIREHEVAQFIFYPVSYNPLRNEVKIIKKFKVRINFKNGDLNKTIKAYNERDNIVFKKLFKNILMNYPLYPQVPSLPVGLLIIVPDEWESYVQPLKKWKKEKGYYVKIAKLSQTGYDTISIRNYIINLYNTWDKNLTFVILVGDVDKIPYFRSSELDNPINDLKYGLIVGNDYFPDIYVGRISIADVSQLQNVINKILNYEKVIWSQGNEWAKRAFFIASADPSWHQVAEQTHLYCMQIVRKPQHGMIADSVFAYYQSGSPTIITNALNNGRSLCTYSGHGMETGWSDYNGLQYTNSNVYNLTNTDKYPLIQSYACLTGKYDVSECFMEAWIRAPNKGGICAFGSSVTSYWDEDDILQRRLFDELFDTGYVWVMGAINQGKIELYNHYGNTPIVHRYFQMYNLFGDPSLVLFTNIPKELFVQHDPAVPPGNVEVQVLVNDQSGPVENALVCAIQNDSILDTKYTDQAGNAVLNLNITSNDTIYLNVTAYNHIPYKGFMLVGTGLPNIPTVISPLDFARMPGLNPTLRFYSTDPQNEGIEYRVKWSLYPDFSVSDSFTTSVYPSGQVVNFNFPYNLELGKTYWWKVKCRDPQGSGYWTSYTQKRSFTVAGSNLPQNTCSWYQTTGAQFNFNTFNGTKVDG